jgi:hypothetical protein
MINQKPFIGKKKMAIAKANFYTSESGKICFTFNQSNEEGFLKLIRSFLPQIFQFPYQVKV